MTGLTRTFVRGRGAELFDDLGRAYLDLVAGFGSMNLGHNHPRVVAAISAALERQAPRVLTVVGQPAHRGAGRAAGGTDPERAGYGLLHE